MSDFESESINSSKRGKIKVKIRIAVAVVVSVVVLAALVTAGTLPTAVRAGWGSTAAGAPGAQSQIVFQEDFSGDFSKWIPISHSGNFEHIFIDTNTGNPAPSLSTSYKGHGVTSKQGFALYPGATIRFDAETPNLLHSSMKMDVDTGWGRSPGDPPGKIRLKAGGSYGGDFRVWDGSDWDIHHPTGWTAAVYHTCKLEILSDYRVAFYVDDMTTPQWISNASVDLSDGIGPVSFDPGGGTRVDNIYVSEGTPPTPTPDCTDGDEDGYGVNGGPDCAHPGEVDCNDGNAAVNPGAAEVCNGIDDNCDRAVDENVKLSFYLDDDRDGYGHLAESVQACNAPDGYVPDNTDCNDDDDAIYPTAAEVCNGFDDNCDGAIDDIHADGDSVNDCTSDRCLGTTEWFAEKKLNPNHYDDSNMNLSDTYGCNCAQILDCKAGEDKGEYKHGCSPGTIEVWIGQSGWAADCQSD